MKTTRLFQALVVAWLAADTGAFAQSTGTPPADAAKADAKAREDRTAGAPNRDRAGRKATASRAPQTSASALAPSPLISNRIQPRA